MAFYTFTSYPQKYMVNTAAIPQPGAGALSDHWDGRPVAFLLTITA
ncbi:hypothetical protein [Amycolatopsis sp. NPDC057786]